MLPPVRSALSHGDHGNWAYFFIIIIILHTCEIKLVVDRQRQQPAIHPDSEANVESTRLHLRQHSSNVSFSSQHEQQQPQPPLQPQARRQNNGQLTCPICLGEATYAVETNCGHVYCGELLSLI